MAVQGTIILPCSCKHEFQDKTYGKGNRVHNISKNMHEAYCTVCSPSFRRNKDKEGSKAETNKHFGQIIDIPKRELSRKPKNI